MRAFWIWLAIGLALRILWAIWVPMLPVSDSMAYDAFARNLVEHGVYGWTPHEPTAYWAVGTSAIVAFTYLFTDGYAGVVLCNLIAGAVIMVCGFVLATRWFGPRVGIATLALIALWPNLIFFTTIMSSELFFLAPMLAGLVFWQRPQGNAMVNLLLAGLFWGLTAYIRPVVLLMPVALALVDLVHGPRRFVASLLEAGIAVLMILLVALPWTMRNERVMGTPATISTNFGANFWMGNNPDSDGGYMPVPDRLSHLSEVEWNAILKEEAKAFWREQPAQALALVGVKLIKLNDRETIGVVWNVGSLKEMIGTTGLTALKAIASAYWYALFFGGLAGIWTLSRGAGWVAAFFNPAVALWGYYMLTHAIIVAGDRYHIPTSPFVATMAAVALVSYLRRRSGQHTPMQAQESVA